MNFQEKLEEAIIKNNSLLCIGLDPEFKKIPEKIQRQAHPQFEFNKAIIDATHDLVCAYKPNSAFYEGLGDKGILQLKMTCDYINAKYPTIPIILDAKRADIGTTNEGYIKYAYDYLQVDAITLHPYLGREALKPFLDIADKGAIILCRTSNPGAGELQDVKIGDTPLYKKIAEHVITEWNDNNNCLLVIGATYPDEMLEIRKIAPHMTFLVPGIGAQGGNLEKTLKAGLDAQKAGLIISSSRGIIFASNDNDFALEAKKEAERLKDEINKFRH